MIGFRFHHVLLSFIIPITTSDAVVNAQSPPTHYDGITKYIPESEVYTFSVLSKNIRVSIYLQT